MEYLYNDKLTATEVNISNIIVENSTCIDFLTVSTVAKLAYVSPSTVIKYAKKLGFDNFNDLKDKVKSSETASNLQNNKFLEISQKISFLLQLLDTNPSMISSLAEAIVDADYIIMYGSGSLASVLNYVAPRIREITNKPVMVQEDVNFLDIEINNSANNLIIFLSACFDEDIIISRYKQAFLKKTNAYIISETVPTELNVHNIVALTNKPNTSYLCDYLCDRTLFFLYFELLVDYFKENPQVLTKNNNN